MRFVKIDNRDFIDLLLPFLKEKGYTQVPDLNGGDDDFIYIDTLRKEWVYCETGFSPFDNYNEMLPYQFKKAHECKLSDLVAIRN